MDHLVGFGERFCSEGDGEAGEADFSGCRPFTMIQCMYVVQDFEDRVNIYICPDDIVWRTTPPCHSYLIIHSNVHMRYDHFAAGHFGFI